MGWVAALGATLYHLGAPPCACLRRRPVHVARRRVGRVPRRLPQHGRLRGGGLSRLLCRRVHVVYVAAGVRASCRAIPRHSPLTPPGPCRLAQTWRLPPHTRPSSCLRTGATPRSLAGSGRTSSSTPRASPRSSQTARRRHGQTTTPTRWYSPSMCLSHKGLWPVTASSGTCQCCVRVQRSVCLFLASEQLRAVVANAAVRRNLCPSETASNAVPPARGWRELGRIIKGVRAERLRGHKS